MASAAIGVVTGFALVGHADPNDPFGTIPWRETAAPKGTGASSPSLDPGPDGAFSYSVPIELPPGRNGFAPKLALHYSSTGALRGGVAAGWTLDLPKIERDLSYSAAPRYVASLGGGANHLVPTPVDVTAEGGVAYHAEYDDFTRYESSVPSSGQIGRWTARTAAGELYEFVPGFLATGDATTRWNVTRQTDRDGNQIDYTWSLVSFGGYMDWAPTEIDYAANPGAGLVAHAKVQLVYAPVETCAGSAVPIGARVDHRIAGYNMYGSRRLTDFVISVRDTPTSAWRQVRDVKLTYDAAALSCSQSGAPLRYLTRIDQTVTSPSGVASAAPPMTFGYGPAQPTYARTFSLPGMGFGMAGDVYGQTSELIDLTGDGIPDQVTMVTGAKCTLYVRPGLPGGGFAPIAQLWTLPTMRWMNGANGSPGTPNMYEACRMGGQLAWRPVICPGKPELPCTGSSANVAYEFVDWDGDGRPDLVAARWGEDDSNDFGGPTLVSYVDNNDGGSNTTSDCGENQHATPDGSGCVCDDGYTESFDGECNNECWTSDGQGPNCNTDNTGQPPPQYTPPYPTATPLLRPLPERRGSSYLVHVFLNTGSGFSPQDDSFYSPLAIFPGGGGTTVADIASPNLLSSVPQLPTFVDIDGDGLVDMITTPRTTIDTPEYETVDPRYAVGRGTEVWVWRNTGNVNNPLGPQEHWPLPPYNQDYDSGVSFTVPGVPEPYHYDSFTHVTLADLDGDGLPDLIANSGSDDTLGVVWNHGGTFGSAYKPLSIKVPLVEHEADYGAGLVFGNGLRGTVNTPFDTDGDGLTDELVFGTWYGDVTRNPANVHNAFRNLGDGPASIAALPAGWEAGKQILRAGNSAYAQTSDVVDLTGDGVPDLVTWDVNGNASVLAEPDHAPLRLLASIDNGHGATTHVTYAPTTDGSAVSLGGAAMPQVRWVVRTVATDPGAGQPAATRTFSYAQPVRGVTSSFDRGAHFVGFKQLTIDELDRRTVDRYATAKSVNGASPDYQLRLVEAQTWAAVRHGLPLILNRDVIHSWSRAQLMAPQVGFTFQTELDEHLCNSSDTPASCTASTTNVRKVASQWLALLLPSWQIACYVHASDVEQWSATQSRATIWSWNLFDSGTDYLISPASEEKDAYTLANGSVTKTTEISRTDWENLDAKHRPRETHVALGAGVEAVTTRTYDAAGNVTTIKKPTQAVLVTGIGYDAFGITRATTLDELGHLVKTTYDLGTGALVHREGPNSRSVTTTTPPTTVYEPESWVLDGFGRTIEHDVAVDPPAGTPGYASYAVETTAYSDATNHRTTTTKLAWTGAGVHVADDSFDGVGRLIGRVESGTGAPASITSALYDYDAHGDFARIRMPDPTDDTKQVAYTYTRDGLGRLIVFSRPDGSYDALTYGVIDTIVAEHAPDGTTNRRSRFFRDLAGRTTSIQEYDNPTAGVIATTRYTVDAGDRVTQIVDADGTTTAIAYDLGGRRTSVTRGARTWGFGYDLDGNPTSRTVPVPAGGTAAQSTSTSTFDPLDRITTHVPATQNLDPTRRTQLGIVTTTYRYDLGPNGVGHLYQASWPFGTRTSYYDVHNNRYADAWSINGPAFGMQASVQRTFQPDGHLAWERWDDSDQWQILYDFRGQPAKVQWLDQSGTAAWKNLASYTRSYAGPPRSRATDYAMTRAWQYDVLGRVAYDRAYVTATGASKSERTYGYDGFGELRAISGQNDGIVADATFDYDATHRLIDAQGPHGYTASFAYSAAGNVTRATVAGADTPNRDARYAYGAVDPQAADALTDWTTGAAIASFAYDASGNVTTRTTSTGVENMVWDADDLLREVSGPAGVERYWYDEAGRRMVAFGPDGARLYTDDNESHYSPTGAKTTRWLHIAAGEQLARIENKTTVELQFTDALGSVMLATDRAGSTTGSFAYGAFGEVLASFGADTHPRQFDGKERDAVSGLHYYGARYYDPLLLRWTGADPLYRAVPDAAMHEPQRANWYAFSLNNPVRYVDPDGRDPTAYVEHDGPTDVVYLVKGTSTDYSTTIQTGGYFDVRFDATIGADSTGAVSVNYTTARTSLPIVDRDVKADKLPADRSASSFTFTAEEDVLELRPTVGGSVGATGGGPSAQVNVTYNWVPTGVKGVGGQAVRVVPTTQSDVNARIHAAAVVATQTLRMVLAQRTAEIAAEKAGAEKAEKARAAQPPPPDPCKDHVCRPL